MSHLMTCARDGAMVSSVQSKRVQQRSTELDVRRLERGDAVELFVDGERRWRPATFDISTAGVAFVELPQRIQFRLEQALLMGLRAPRAPIGVDGARPQLPRRS